MQPHHPPIILSCSTPPRILESESTAWTEKFISSSSEQLISSPSNAPEQAFELLVSTFTDLLKAKLNSLITPETTSYSFCESLNLFSSTLPSLLTSLELNNSLSVSNSDIDDSPQIVVFSTLDDRRPSIKINICPIEENSPTSFDPRRSTSISPSHIDESSEKKLEKIEGFEDDAIQCTLYRRVLAIFKKSNRTVHDLYTAIDVNRDGKINAAEVRTELFRHDQSITLEEAFEVFKILDGDKDGFVTEDDMNKRMKFIVEKCVDEEKDPLSCIIVSKNLDPDSIHGVISVSLLKVAGFKAGTRCIRFKLKDVLEYLTPDIVENLLTFNFKSEFLLENQSLGSLPTVIDIDLINKNKAEGHASLNWTRSNSISNEFSYKHKLDIKTSTGQAKGSINLQVSWSPIFAKILSHDEQIKLEELKQKAQEYQAQLETKKKITRTLTHRLTVELPPSEEEDSYLEEAKLEVSQNYLPRGGSGYFINVCKKSIETLHSPKLSIPRSPNSQVHMDFLAVRSVKRNYTEVERPKTPTASKRNSDGLVSSRMLTPNKNTRNGSMQF